MVSNGDGEGVGGSEGERGGGKEEGGGVGEERGDQGWVGVGLGGERRVLSGMVREVEGLTGTFMGPFEAA